MVLTLIILSYPDPPPGTSIKGLMVSIRWYLGCPKGSWGVLEDRSQEKLLIWFGCVFQAYAIVAMLGIWNHKTRNY